MNIYVVFESEEQKIHGAFTNIKRARGHLSALTTEHRHEVVACARAEEAPPKRYYHIYETELNGD